MIQFGQCRDVRLDFTIHLLPQAGFAQVDSVNRSGAMLPGSESWKPKQVRS